MKVSEKDQVADQVEVVRRDQEVLQRLLSWFEDNRRSFPWREGRLEPWQVLIAEILLQQTQAERVSAFLPGFLAEFPELEMLLDVDEAALASRLASLGLHRRRAQRLQALAGALLALEGQVPQDKEGLRQLPGVGPYIAAAFLSTVLDRPEPMVDVNMARLVERLYGPRTLADIRYDPHINGIAARLVALAPRARDFNWAVLDLCAACCTARRPNCEDCPLLPVCPSGENWVRVA